ncbi:MAG: hypothetical protein ACOYOK_00910 [Pseudobdellovibrionaceae bacterium]
MRTGSRKKIEKNPAEPKHIITEPASDTGLFDGLGFQMEVVLRQRFVYF